MDNPNNLNNFQITYSNLESRIRNNEFKDKEILIKEITELRKNGSQLSNTAVEELLRLYDSLHKSDELPLDMQNYKSVGLENQNLIVSTERDKILKTNGNTSAMSEEFKQNQNEIVANNQDGIATSDDVFKRMETTQKEEVTLIPLSESINYNNISTEVLSKIKFFITNQYINPYSYKVNLENGIFYNVETDETLEIRKDTQTGKYHIYRGSEIVYENNEQTVQQENDVVDIDNIERDEEEMAYESRLNKPKVRTLQKPTYPNNAAFTKISFLVINVLTFALLITMIILLNK